jgi:hypothetical protein
MVNGEWGWIETPPYSPSTIQPYREPHMKACWWTALLVGLVGCSTPEASAFDAERPWRQQGDVIDSILPMAEHERRFREGLPEVTALAGGAPSREVLAQRFLAAVERGDSNALAGMSLTRAEFAWLLFPHHLYREPPYELEPGMLWMQLQQGSAKGLARVLERHGREPMEYRGLHCERDTLQLPSGAMQLWGDCQLTYRTADSTLTRRLFGSMVEYGGVVKFLSYANDF